MLMANSSIQMGGGSCVARSKARRRACTGKTRKKIVQQGNEARGLCVLPLTASEVDFIVFSTGIRPRDKLAAVRSGRRAARRGS